MITISLIGLDQYAVMTYSREHTKKLADLFEVKPDAINFYAPNAFFYHDGVDQTSWNTLVRVHAPNQVQILEEKVTAYLISTLMPMTINISIEFFYYDKKNRHDYLNREYPHFITEANAVVVEDEDEEIEEDDEEIYDGNVFAEFEEKIK